MSGADEPLSLALAVNAALFLAVFGLLTQRPVVVRELLPGVTLAAVGSLILQSIGGWHVDRTVTGAGDTYGTFALVIGLLSWFWLGSHLLLLAVDVNVDLHRPALAAIADRRPEPAFAPGWTRLSYQRDEEDARPHA